MTLSDRIQLLLDKTKTSQSELEKILGFGKGTITKWKGTTAPSADKLQRIAEYFGVTIDYLITGYTDNNISNPCRDCGLSYDDDDPSDVIYHEQYHASWKSATAKFGRLYSTSRENEKVKGENRNIANNLSLPLDERYDAQLLVLRCLFSRSIIANNFDLNHVSFDGYVAMMFNNEKYRNNIDKELCQKIISIYGTLPGIPNGESIYHVPKNSHLQTLAAHFDGKEYTEDELDEIQRYAEFVKSKRKS